MKKLLLTLSIVFTAVLTYAQAPSTFSYQAVVRDASNDLVVSSIVGTQISILQGTSTGSAVYVETHAPTTNANGLISLQIGDGTVVSGTFASIDWSNGPYFIKTETDPTGGTSYTIAGTSQLLSVPYALHANTAENVTNDLVDDADADPTNELQDISLTGSDLTLSSGSTIDLSVIDTDTDTQLDETAVDAFVSNNGYITSPDDADADPNNEIQTISRTGTTVTLSNGGGTFEDSVGVYTAGTGINITNNVISAPGTASGTCGLSIGDTYQGGIIFYLDASGCHGLISAPTDQTTGIPWFNGSFTDTYASGSGLFDGDGNCYRIRISQGNCASCNAAELCLDLTLGGYSDWYLPSKYELNLMYQNIGQGNALGLGNVGGFASSFYWSSTEIGSIVAWRQGFGSGNQFDGGKDLTYYVRAIRAF